MAEISIIIPLYNKEKHIKATLKSVLEQTFQDFEVIVVNDGSTDRSLEEVGTLTDDRIKVFTIDNQGVSYARNYGVEKATSKLMAFLDGDDLWKPNHLEDLKRSHQEFPDCGMYATAYEHSFNGNIIPSVYHNLPKEAHWFGIVDDFFESSRINCIASSSSVMIPKHVYQAVGGFNTNYNSGEDIDLWIRIALLHPIAFTTTVSVVITMSGDNQASLKSINERSVLDLDAYPEERTNKSLKTYLDLNRFSVAIQHQLAGNPTKAKPFMENIDRSNLNGKQRFLLELNGTTIRLLMKFKNVLRKNGIGLSVFR